MSDIQKKFYVLRAISGKENKVREYLEAELKNTDLGEYVSQVLIPTEKTFTITLSFFFSALTSSITPVKPLKGPKVIFTFSPT